MLPDHAVLVPNAGRSRPRNLRTYTKTPARLYVRKNAREAGTLWRTTPRRRRRRTVPVSHAFGDGVSDGVMTGTPVGIPGRYTGVLPYGPARADEGARGDRTPCRRQDMYSDVWWQRNTAASDTTNDGAKIRGAYGLSSA